MRATGLALTPPTPPTKDHPMKQPLCLTLRRIRSSIRSEVNTGSRVQPKGCSYQTETLSLTVAVPTTAANTAAKKAQ